MRRTDAPERFLATVLFTDIVGSTEIAERLGDRAWRDLLNEFYARVRRQLRRSAGTELDTAGDGLFAAFDSPASAVECALAITRDVEDLGIAVRCGLHAGEVERLGRKVGGIAVHIGARVAALAGPNEVWATRTVRELATGSPVRFDDRGDRELKGIEQPWRLYAVVAERPAAETSVEARARRATAAAPMRRRRRPIWARHPRATAAIAVAAMLAAVSAGYLFITTPPVLSGVDPDSVGLIDAGRSGVIGQLKVGSQPSDLAFGEGSLWVVNTGSDTVSRVDPQRRSTVDTIQVGAEPEGIAIGFGAVWVANSGSGTVSQINPATNTVVRTIPTGNGPTDVVVAHDSVWVANLIDGTVVRISPDRGEVVAVIEVGASPTALATDERSVWVTNRDAGAVTRIDIARGTATESVNVGSQPNAIAIGAGAVWVGNGGDATVSRIDADSRRVVATVVVPPQPSGIAVSRDAVWVASRLDGSIARIDPGTGSLRAVRVVSSPERVAVDDGGRVWFSARASAASHRGGTLRVVYPGRPSIDPALAYSVEEWYIMNAAYNGLVAYRQVPGAGGSLLVPNLAEAIPTPGDGGTTYTFRVREGIRYSDGTAFGPADVRHAIERGFEVAPSEDDANAPTFYGGIVGADDCTKAIGTDADCDLAEGIEVDEAQRTVTFRLVEADPDFLYKLAMPFAYAIPADVPSRAVSTPIPATGPYMIAQDSDSSVLRLVRNPEFRVWSPEARPDGFPNEIVWDLGGEEDAAVDRVVAGEADVVATTSLPLERIPDLLARHTNQIHVRPAGTAYMALDTTQPPFDDVRVRQAVNYAVDRERVVELLGGEAQATTTCQVILPNFHGYRRFCPYTIDPGPAGVWTGPDRTRAVQLVAGSSAAGAQVEIWTIDEPALRVIAKHLVEVLTDIGLEPSLKVPPPEGFAEVFSTTADREANAVVIGWFPDYPAASTFLEPNFRCGLASNLSRYCDPALEERMQEARRLQGTDPVASAEIWAEVDRRITEAGVWVPVATYNQMYLVSERVGNVQLHAQWGMLLDQLWVE